VPLAGLAALALERLQPGRLRRFCIALLFCLAIPSNLLVLLTARQGAATHDPLLYLSRSEARAFEWIAANTPPDALILAAPESGLFIPAHTGRRVVYGHPFETANAGDERAILEAFFSGTAPDIAPFSERGADYLFVGPRENELGGELPTAGLTRAYTVQGVSIYAIQD
jgi:hypothetical protein